MKDVYVLDATKQRARGAVHRAIRRGELHKPARCQECDRCAPLHAHHHNGYENPLDVQWLCRRCHDESHHGRREYLPHPMDMVIVLVAANRGEKSYSWSDGTIIFDKRQFREVMEWLRKHRPPITFEPQYRHLFDAPSSLTTGLPAVPTTEGESRGREEAHLYTFTGGGTDA